MATSGSIDFSITRDKIIKASLRKLGVLSRHTDPDPEDIDEAAEALNAMIKAWDAQGIHLWKYATATLFPNPSQIEYNLPGANATTSFDETELAVAGVATDLTVTVDDASDISDADFILVGLDDNTWHSTTVNGAPAGNVVTITDALPSGAAIDNDVITYTTKINRPLRVHDIQRRVSGQDTQVIMIAREEYNQLPNKSDTGIPNQAYYDPQLNTGILSIWPTVSTNAVRLRLTISRTIEDFDIASNTPDFPQEWYECLVFNLAVRLGPEYEVGAQKMSEVKILADEYLDIASSWDREEVSLYFQPTDSPYNN